MDARGGQVWGREGGWPHEVSKSEIKPRFLETLSIGRYIYVFLEHDNRLTALPVNKPGELFKKRG